MTSYIAVDLGGTNIRAARYDGQGQLIARAKHPTDSDNQENPVANRVIACVQEVIGHHASDVSAIAIGAPGPINPFMGVVIRAPNVPGWKNFPLKQVIEKRFNIPTEIGNDANMAALGEWKFGAGRGHQDVLYLTISTGIGGGIVSGGKLLVGAHGIAAEMGHITIVPDGPVCGCGQRGHLEALASGPSMARTARTRLRAGTRSSMLDLVEGDIEAITAQHIGDAARMGDDFARSIVAEAGGYIGRALADFLHILNPSIIILGGGVSNMGELIIEPARAAMKRLVMTDDYFRECNIVQAQLGDDVGLLGALALAMELHPA